MSQYIWISPEAGMKIDELRTPCYVIDEGKLSENISGRFGLYYYDFWIYGTAQRG
jgi:hypothetical protein